MARSKGDGVEYCGKETRGKHKGEHKWRARNYWTELLTGVARESVHTFYLPTSARPRAVARREELLAEDMKATPVGKAAKVERKRFKDASAAWYAALEAEVDKGVRGAGTLNVWGCYRGLLDAHFGEWFLDMIEVRHLKEYFAELKPTGKTRSPNKRGDYDPGTVNGVRQVAKHIFTFAIDRGWLEGPNPVDAVPRRSTRLEGLTELGEEPKRHLEEHEAVLHLCDLRDREPEAYPLVLTAYHVGSRFGEVSAWRLEDLDLDTGKVKIRRGQYKGRKGRTKGRYARVAGLPRELCDFLRQHIARVQSLGYPGADELVFPRPPWQAKRGRRHDRKHDFWSASTLHRIIDRSYKRIGLRGEDVENPVRNTTHTARHTVATLAEGLVSDTVLRKVLGQNAEVNRKYKHPGLAQVVELGEHMARKLGPKAKGQSK